SVAEAGYPAVLLSVPLGFAIFNPSAASRPIASLPGVRKWVLAGHSLGGVAASLYAREHQDIIAGIVYLGSYPPGGGSLAGTKIKALSLSGTNDMLATAEKIDKAKPLLPESVRYVVIQGGNHAQFGDYGPQRGDGVAEITPRLQQSIVVESVLALLASMQ
ncbi:MAG: alpha/beta family hydrolase, partial [Spirochaetales bacterium]